MGFNSGFKGLNSDILRRAGSTKTLRVWNRCQCAWQFCRYQSVTNMQAALYMLTGALLWMWQWHRNIQQHPQNITTTGQKTGNMERIFVAYLCRYPGICWRNWGKLRLLTWDRDPVTPNAVRFVWAKCNVHVARVWFCFVPQSVGCWQNCWTNKQTNKQTDMLPGRAVQFAVWEGITINAPFIQFWEI